jgi:hypothetical protein
MSYRAANGGYRYRLAAWLAAGYLLLLPLSSEAALPMITDDAGTQGKGKFQIEVAVEHDRDKEQFAGVTTREADYAVAAVFTAGVTDSLDLAIGAPYLWTSSNDDLGQSSRVNGIGDTVLVAKWRFFEKERLSLALKPYVDLPSGNDNKDLGSGKVNYGLFFITSAEQEPWAVHFNLGYTRNLNTIGERTDIWRVSAAAVYSVNKQWKLCADTGIRTNTDKTSETEPAYLLVGFIYAPVEILELSLGVLQGLNDESTDWSIFPGVTYRF